MPPQQARRPTAFLSTALMVLLVALPAAAQVIPRDEAPRIAALMGDVGLDRPLAGGLAFTDVQIDHDRVTVVLSRESGGTVVGRIHLVPPEEARPGDRHSRSFAIRTEALAPDPNVAAALRAGAESVVHRDPGGLLVAPASAPEVGPVAHRSPTTRRHLWLARTLLALALLAGAAGYVLGPWARARRRHARSRSSE